MGSDRATLRRILPPRTQTAAPQAPTWLKNLPKWRGGCTTASRCWVYAGMPWDLRERIANEFKAYIMMQNNAKPRSQCKPGQEQRFRPKSTRVLQKHSEIDEHRQFAGESAEKLLLRMQNPSLRAKPVKNTDLRQNRQENCKSDRKSTNTANS